MAVAPHGGRPGVGKVPAVRSRMEQVPGEVRPQMAAVPPPVTIVTIAREAGVSAPTVSKVLNGRADVAAATRARVEESLRRHNYQRRHKPETRRSALLDIVVPGLDSPWALEMIRGVEHVAHEHGLGVVVSVSARRTTPEENWITSVLARRPVGVLLFVSGLTVAQRSQFRSRDIPFVVVDPAEELPDDVAWVGSANLAGGRLATEHLLGLGHRRIGVIGGPAHLLPSRARVDGFRAAMSAAGEPVDPQLVRYGEFDVGAGYTQGHHLLTLAQPPTAVFAGNDLQAVGLYEAARELGVRIPQDLSVVGYDDLSVATWVGPELTTVHQPLFGMAEAATTLLLQLGRDESPASRRIDLPVALVARASTTRPAPV